MSPIPPYAPPGGGVTVLYGSGAPSNANGNNGDLYFDTGSAGGEPTGSIAVTEVQDGNGVDAGEEKTLFVPVNATGTFTLSMNFGGTDMPTPEIDASNVTAQSLNDAFNASGWWVAPGVTQDDENNWTLSWGPAAGNLSPMTLDDAGTTYGVTDPSPGAAYVKEAGAWTRVLNTAG